MKLNSLALTHSRMRSLRLLVLAVPLLGGCFWNDTSTEPTKTIATISMLPIQATVRVGQTINLVASARAEDGDPIFGQTYVWASGDTAVLESRPGGVFYGKKVGSTTASASTGGFTGVAQITVTP